MDIYKRAIKEKIVFPTVKGTLSITQIFQLSLLDLAAAIKESKANLKSNTDTDLEFLETTPPTVDAEEQLRFEVLKDVFLTKKEEADSIRTAKEKKEYNQKILALIEDKKEDAFKNLSVAELEALLQK